MNGLGRLDIDENFDNLVLGDIHGQGVYNGWSPWVVVTGDGATAHVVAKDGGGQMLRLVRTSGAVNPYVYLDWNDPDNNWGLSAGYFMKVKMRRKDVSSSTGFIYFRDGATNHYQFYFRNTSQFCVYPQGGGYLVLWNTVDDVWYDLGVLFTTPTDDNLTIFKDGDYCNYKSLGGQSRYNINRIYFALTASTDDDYFDIDDFKLYTLRNPAE